MGDRIAFYKCTSGSYAATVHANYPHFRDWYLAFAQSSLEEYGEEFGTQELKEYLTLHTSTEAMPAQLLDEYCVEFIYAYDDFLYTEQQNKFVLFGPTMNKRRYKESTTLIANTNDEHLIKLWSYIVHGRSLSGKSTFISTSNEARIGYITTAERKLLQTKLQLYFPLNNNTAEGISYVRQMLEEVVNENNDVVITIDGTE